ERTVAVLNESWTTVEDGTRLAFPQSGRILTVAAVGNDPEKNVHVEPIVGFAGLSNSLAYVIAVMTLTENGDTDCDTSLVDYTAEDLGAVGYLGTVPGDCGSSYASPRVAWFIAARETIRPEPMSGDHWARDVRRQLRVLRTDRVSMPRSLLFRPEAYLGSPEARSTTK